MKNVSLVLTETGAHWTDSVHAWRNPENELVVLIRQHEESHQEFQRRVAQRLERLRNAAVRLDQILLVTGSCQLEGCRVPRARLLHSVVASVRGRTETASVDRLEDLASGAPKPGSCMHCTGAAVPPRAPNALGFGLCAEQRPTDPRERS